MAAEMERANNEIATLKAQLRQMQRPVAAPQLALGVVVDQPHIRLNTTVLFIRKLQENKVAFEAVCRTQNKYFLHEQCVIGGMEARDYLVGDVFLIGEEEQNGSILVWASFK